MPHNAYDYIVAVTTLIGSLTALIVALRNSRRINHIRDRVAKVETRQAQQGGTEQGGE